jgi:hypothetical protein
MSIELWEWFQRVDKARGILEMPGGMWSERCVALWAGDSARRVWWKGQDMGRLWAYVGVARVRVQEARG